MGLKIRGILITFILLLIFGFCSGPSDINQQKDQHLNQKFKVFTENDITYISGFSRPMGVNIGPDGSLYVAEFDRAGKQGFYRFSDKLKYQGLLTYNASRKSTGWFIDRPSTFFNKPHCVDFNDKGELFITDFGTKKIYKFTDDGKYISSYSSKLTGPATAYFDNSNNLLISDYNSNTVVICNESFEYQFSINDGFKQVHCTKMDKNNNMYVVDHRNHRVLKYNSSKDKILCIGKSSKAGILKNWGKKQDCISGNEEGAFYDPIAIDFDVEGNIYILEYGNNRIQKFNSDGEFVKVLNTNLHRPYDFKISNDKIYVTDSDKGRIQILKLL